MTRYNGSTIAEKRLRSSVKKDLIDFFESLDSGVFYNTSDVRADFIADSGWKAITTQSFNKNLSLWADLTGCLIEFSRKNIGSKKHSGFLIQRKPEKPDVDKNDNFQPAKNAVESEKK